MSSTTKTLNYSLSQFADSDKPSWRGDYTGDMAKIDKGLQDNANAITDAHTAANNAQATADRAEGKADNGILAAAQAKTTADNALSLAQTNEDSIETLNADMANIAKTVDDIVDLASLKAPGDSDYTNAWNACLDLVKTRGVDTIWVSRTVGGTFRLEDTQNVTITGGGCFTSPITIDDALATNENQSNITITNMRFDVEGNHAIIITRGRNIKVSNCSIKVDSSHACVYGDVAPSINQQIAQCIISNNHMSGGTGVKISPANTDISTMSRLRYLGADIHINNNVFLNTKRNIHLGMCDGGIISGNTLFLSQGGSDKRENMLLDVMSYSIIDSNQCFEAGSNGIHVTNNNSAIITNNNIIWCGQYVQSSGILLEKGAALLPTHAICYNVINGNSIVQPTKHGIESSDKNVTQYVGNSIHQPGSSAHWKGDTALPSGAFYGICDETGEYISAVGNMSDNGYGVRTPKNTTGINLNMANPGQLDISSNILSLQPTTITSAEQISFSNKNNLLVINNVQTIAKSDIISKVNKQPITVVFAVYGGACEIAGKTLQQNTAAMALIYADNIYWL